MTTVACDGFTMASDTSSSMDGNILPNQQKVLRVGDYIVGSAGVRWRRKELVEWVRNSMDDAEAPQLEDAVGLVLTPRGRIVMVDGGGATYYFNKPMAVGAGALAARAAMMHGATAREAVKTAIELDLYTNGRVHALDLKT